MTISLIATVSQDAASGNISFTHGLTIASGDVLIATVNANGAGNTVTDNNGATPFTFDDYGDNPDSARYYVFHRVCGGSEPSSYAFTLGSSNRRSIVIRQYRGVDSAVWDVAPSATTRDTGSGDATSEAKAITIVTSGACGLVLMGDDFTPTTTTYSSINNSYGNVKSESGQQYQATADKLGLSTGSTGITTITSSSTVSWVAYQVALKPSSGLSATLNQNTETDTAQALTKSKRKAIGQNAETNTAQTVTRVKRKSLTQPSETDSAQAVARIKRKTIGLNSESEIAQSITRRKVKVIGQVLESDSAQVFTVRKTKIIAQISEADTAQAISRIKVKAIGQDFETDTAQSILSIKRKSIGQVEETDSAQPFTETGALVAVIGQVIETDLAQQLFPLKRVSIGQVVEVDSAQSMRVVKIKIIGQAIEIDIAQTLSAEEILILRELFLYPRNAQLTLESRTSELTLTKRQGLRLKEL